MLQDIQYTLTIQALQRTALLWIPPIMLTFKVIHKHSFSVISSISPIYNSTLSPVLTLAHLLPTRAFQLTRFPGLESLLNNTVITRSWQLQFFLSAANRKLLIRNCHECTRRLITKLFQPIKFIWLYIVPFPQLFDFVPDAVHFLRKTVVFMSWRRIPIQFGPLNTVTYNHHVI